MHASAVNNATLWHHRHEPILLGAVVTELSRLDVDALRRLPQDGELHVDLVALASGLLKAGDVRITLDADAAEGAVADGLTWRLSFTYMPRELVTELSPEVCSEACLAVALAAFDHLSREALFELATRHAIAMDPTDVAHRRLMEEASPGSST